MEISIESWSGGWSGRLSYDSGQPLEALSVLLLQREPRSGCRRAPEQTDRAVSKQQGLPRSDGQSGAVEQASVKALAAMLALPVDESLSCTRGQHRRLAGQSPVTQVVANMQQQPLNTVSRSSHHSALPKLSSAGALKR